MGYQKCQHDAFLIEWMADDSAPATSTSASANSQKSPCKACGSLQHTYSTPKQCPRHPDYKVFRHDSIEYSMEYSMKYPMERSMERSMRPTTVRTSPRLRRPCTPQPETRKIYRPIGLPLPFTDAAQMGHSELYQSMPGVGMDRCCMDVRWMRCMCMFMHACAV